MTPQQTAINAAAAATRIAQVLDRPATTASLDDAQVRVDQLAEAAAILAKAIRKERRALGAAERKRKADRRIVDRDRAAVAARQRLPEPDDFAIPVPPLPVAVAA